MSTRLTIQKTRILDYLRSVKTHPTAEMVYQEVKKDIPTITLATVYRNLNQMAVKGKICRLEVNKEYRYDADIGLHQHCVCNNCGKIMDLMQADISKTALNRIKVKGFFPNSVNIIFRGECAECSKVAQ